MVRVVANGRQGSGVIVDRSELILTANHLVVDGVTEVSLELADGQTLTGTVMGRDYASDVALIAVQKSGLTPVPIGDSDNVKAGDILVKIGYVPGRLGPPTTNANIVSAVEHDDRFEVTIIQTDEALGLGDSGSPLLNLKGELVAINSPKLTASPVEGVSHAVAINDVADIIDRLALGDTICQPLPAIIDGSIYRNSIHKYLVTMPEGSLWVPEQFEDGTALIARVETFTTGTIDRPESSGVWVRKAGTRLQYPTLMSYLDSWLDTLGASFAELDILSTRHVCAPEAARAEALKVEARVVSGRTEYIERWLLFFIGGEGYLLEGFAYPAKWSLQEDNIDSSMYSFRLEE